MFRESILIAAFFCLFGCSSVATLETPVQSDSSRAAIGKTVSQFAAEKGMSENDSPWIRSYNAWANSSKNQLLRSWEGEYDGQHFMFVELLREGAYVILIDADYGHGSLEAMTNELKERLESTGIEHPVVKDTQWFFGLN